jgi:hypothetical protein
VTENNTVIIAVSVVGGVVLLSAVMISFSILCYSRTKKTKRPIIRPPDFQQLAFSDFNLKNQKVEKMKKNQKFMLGSMETLLLKEEFADLAIKVLKEDEAFIRNLMIVYEANGMSLNILSHYVKKYIATQSKTSPGTIFREDSVCTKLFRTYSMMVAMPYLWKTLANILHEVVMENEHGRGHSGLQGFELDPTRISHEDVDEGIRKFNLLLLCQKIFVAIKNSAADVPAEMREFFKAMYDALKDQLPEKDPTVVVGSFFFLRIICPALVLPHQYGLLPDPSTGEWGQQTGRVLMLVSKVLQSLSNKAEFGAKESFMNKLTEFVETNSSSMHMFVEDLVNCQMIDLQIRDDTVPTAVHVEAMKLVYKDVSKNGEEVVAEVYKQYSAEKAKKLRDRIVLLT